MLWLELSSPHLLKSTDSFPLKVNCGYWQFGLSSPNRSLFSKKIAQESMTLVIVCNRHCGLFWGLLPRVFFMLSFLGLTGVCWQRGLHTPRNRGTHTPIIPYFITLISRMIPLGRHCPFQGKTVTAWWDVLWGPAPISTWSLKVFLSFPSCPLTLRWSQSTENELGGKVYDVGFSSPCSARSVPFHISVGVWPAGVPLSANSPRQENPGRPAHGSSGEVLSYFLKNITNEWNRWVSWLRPFTGNSSFLTFFVNSMLEKESYRDRWLSSFQSILRL